MKNQITKSILLSGCAFAVLAFGLVEAKAGGLAIREQSAYGQGTSFAGVAAGGSLSSMFWNPATMTQVGGLASESNFAGIFPYAANSPTAGTLFALGGTSNTGDAALVPASYTTWQFNPNMWLGISFNSPFGLSVNFPDLWAGRNYAQSSSLRTLSATPSLAYRINDMISIGLGVQIQNAKADLNSGLLPAPGSHTNLSGSGWAYGATAGITVTPGPNTTIGLGWRSALNQKLSGTLASSPILPGSTLGSIDATVNLPDMLSLGIRHHLDPRWTLMGTVEWSRWSRIGTTAVLQPTGAPATIAGTIVQLPFQYQDGWFYSVGAEYVVDQRTTLRAGIGYEVSPITDRVRTPRLPDNDRFWLSVGLSYTMMPNLTMDLAYSHIFVKDTPINITAASGNPWFSAGVDYVGNATSHVDIFSIAMKYRFSPEPVKPLIRKG
jgi:long-chain fatty acid transport protein